MENYDSLLGGVPVEGGALFCFQFRAMLRKNAILIRRNCKDLFREILIPCVYLTIMIIIRHALLDQEYAAKHNYPVSEVASWHSPKQFENWFEYAHSTEYQDSPDPLTIAYAHETQMCGQSAMEAVMQAMEAQVVFTLLTFKCFNSSAELESQEMKSGNIFFGIVFENLPELPPASLTDPVRSACA